MKLAIDLDDVCFDFVGKFSEQFGPAINPTGGLYNMWPTVPKEVVDYVVSHDEIYQAMEPVKDAAETLHKMASLSEIEYVTARQSAVAGITILKLTKHGFPAFPLVMTGSHDAKIEYLLANAFDFILDDSPKIVTSVKDTIAFPYLMTRPWNVQLDWQFRVLGWREFYERFL